MNQANKSQGCWGCFGSIMILLGIVELIIGIFTFNIVLILWAIVSTFIFAFLIGGKLKNLEESKNNEEEIVEGEQDDQIRLF